jgi:predicted TIM-barrel fold metal-dependent hydrolase
MSIEQASRYVVISADTHAGANIVDYKQYLDSEFHDDFDAWAVNFHDGWQDFELGSSKELAPSEAEEVDDDALRLGVGSFMSPYNWESDTRMRHLEGEGVVGEVIFPNTVPPFYPSGVLSAAAPRTKEEYRYRSAGVKAHNRWLADFCAAVPGRRAGVAQIFLTDIDDAVAEVHWAKEHGLSGILIPSDHHRGLVNLYGRQLDPFWAACSETGLPVHRHVQPASDADESGPAGAALGIFEIIPFFSRTLPQLMIGGVFHRHPNLKFVCTEAMGAWVPSVLANLDRWYKLARTEKGSTIYVYGHDAISDQTMLPSEYFARNCYLGSFLADLDIAARHNIGLDRIMWGSDYPHQEGTYPYTELALRKNFSGVPEDEVRMMVGGNAAKVYGFDLPFLQTVADKFGPTVERLTVPVSPEEIPIANVCPTFHFETSGHASGQRVSGLGAAQSRPTVGAA